MVTATGPAPGSDMMTSAEPAENRTASGVLYVAPIFASHMVLQRNKPIVVFGALNADCAGLEVTAATVRLTVPLWLRRTPTLRWRSGMASPTGASCCRPSPKAARTHCV